MVDVIPQIEITVKTNIIDEENILDSQYVVKWKSLAPNETLDNFTDFVFEI